MRNFDSWILVNELNLSFISVQQESKTFWYCDPVCSHFESAGYQWTGAHEKVLSLHVKIRPCWLRATESCSRASSSCFHFPYSLKQFVYSLGDYCGYGWLKNPRLCMWLTWKENFYFETQFLNLSLQYWNSKSCLGLYPEISSHENMQSCCQKAVYC